MKFQRVKLSNFKCYDDADLRLDNGVTVIHGLNGSGKSSLLEACFFALYGSKALDENLGDVVTIGADDCTVELWFSHAGGDYHLTRRVRATGAQPTTAKCVLEAPREPSKARATFADAFRPPADGRRGVRELRVRPAGRGQQAHQRDAGERQDMLDDLLQLGKLEAYRERAGDARVGVGRDALTNSGALSNSTSRSGEGGKGPPRAPERPRNVGITSRKTSRTRRTEDHRRGDATQAESVLEEYEEYATTVDPRSRHRGSEATITETETERTELNEQVSDLQDQRESLREDLSETVAKTDLDSSEPDPETVDARLDELQSRDDDLQSRIEDQRVDAKDHSSTADALAESAADLESRAEDKREEAAELETVATLRGRLSPSAGSRSATSTTRSPISKPGSRTRRPTVTGRSRTMNPSPVTSITPDSR
ncbi:hypothetical protein C9J85_09455 [Haloferax sp. wsp5]|nr:hypothetical protein C9J85_09455 [Haloferax sp. wsp5]